MAVPNRMPVACITDINLERDIRVGWNCGNVQLLQLLSAQVHITAKVLVGL